MGVAATIMCRPESTKKRVERTTHGTRDAHHSKRDYLFDQVHSAATNSSLGLYVT